MAAENLPLDGSACVDGGKVTTIIGAQKGWWKFCESEYAVIFFLSCLSPMAVFVLNPRNVL